MKYRYWLPLILALPLLGGCVFESYRTVTEYDLVPGKVKTQSQIPFVLSEFRNESSAGVRFLYRDNSGLVQRDPYHNWVLPPGELVKRALDLTLKPRSGPSAIPVEGTLTVFEVERSTDSFRLAGTFQAWPKTKNEMYRFDYSVPLKGTTPKAVAAAASECLRLLAEQIAQTQFQR